MGKFFIKKLSSRSIMRNFKSLSHTKTDALNLSISCTLQVILFSKSNGVVRELFFHIKAHCLNSTRCFLHLLTHFSEMLNMKSLKHKPHS